MKIIDVIREEAARGGFTVEQVLAKDLHLRVRKIRQYAMWRARNETGRSWAAIGQAFNRDHTTVLHAWQRVEAMTPEQRVALPTIRAKRIKPVRIAEPPKPRTHLYFRGVDCVRGHGGRRYIATGACIECKRLRDYRRRHAKILDGRNGRATADISCAAVE